MMNKFLLALSISGAVLIAGRSCGFAERSKALRNNMWWKHRERLALNSALTHSPDRQQPFAINQPSFAFGQSLTRPQHATVDGETHLTHQAPSESLLEAEIWGGEAVNRSLLKTRRHSKRQKRCARRKVAQNTIKHENYLPFKKYPGNLPSSQRLDLSFSLYTDL